MRYITHEFAHVETLERCRRWLIFACARDKDVPGMLRVLLPHFAHAFLTQFHNNPRSVSPTQLADLVHQNGDVPCTICPTTAEAWQQARQAAGPNDLICVTGSVYLAGEIRPMLL